MAPRGQQITQLLKEWSRGDEKALERLTPFVYAELHRLAAARLGRGRASHTLQPTALIHEAFVRLIQRPAPDWQDRAHFFGIAARLMRQILVDHARRRRAARHGGGAVAITLDESRLPAKEVSDVVDLSDALEKLAAFDERKARAVELRYFGGLTQEESALVLGVHTNTVARDLLLGEAWLRKHLG